jgi:hypothetical protein
VLADSEVGDDVALYEAVDALLGDPEQRRNIIDRENCRKRPWIWRLFWCGCMKIVAGWPLQVG